MKKRAICAMMIFALAICISTVPAQAQNETAAIFGTVTDAGTGEPITGAIIALQSSQGKHLKYTTSDNSGAFTLGQVALSPGDSLHASMLGYRNISLVPTPGKRMSLKMEIEAMNIREVTIRAPKIKMRGDTVSYNISSFAEAQDKNLGDVLKKLPGIEVEKSGQIKYNGAPINKLYIEGTDMLGGRYGIATNNIPPKDVKSVEVMENHQPTKALQDIAYSEQAAINIKLQEGAKARWLGTADLRAGFSGNLLDNSASGNPVLWDGKIFGMRIGKNWQSMNTLKSNNSGMNLRNEINAFSYNDIFSGNSSYDLKDFQGVGVSNAPLAEERVRINQTHLFNTTNTFKLSDDYQLNLQGSYLYDRLTSSNSSQTSYFLEDSTITVEEIKEAATMVHSASANAELLANTDKFYLKNNLTFSGQWSSADASMTGSYPNTQRGVGRILDIDDNFQFTKRIGKQAFTIASYNKYSHKPQTLRVLRDKGTQTQDVTQSAFYSDTYSSYGHSFGKGWSISLKGGFNALIRTLESDLSGVETEFPTSNDVHLSYTDLYIQPTLVYKSTIFTASLNVPMNYYHYWYRQTGTRSLENDDFIIRPRLFLKYNITPKFLISASGTIGESAVDEKNFYDGLILTSYRYLRQGIKDFDNTIAKSISAGFEYKDPINTLFFNGTLSRSWNTIPNLSRQTFIGDYIVNSYIPYSNQANMWLASLGGSKGFYGINGLVGIDATFTSSEATMFQSVESASKSPVTAGATSSLATSDATMFQTVQLASKSPATDEATPALTPYRSTTFTFSPRFNGRLAHWLLLEYRLTYNHSILELTDAKSTSSNDNFDHSLTLTFTPFPKLHIKAVAEHYFTQITSTQNKNTLLADILARYSLNDHIELTLTATNILNQKVYTYTTFNGPSSFTATYQIRPLNILLGAYWKF